MSLLLEAEGLHKRYGTREVVAGVSLAARAGEIVGLLGPNGAGKSTTIAMVCGLTPADAGQVRVAGISLAQDEAGCKRRIGLVSQDLALFDDLGALRQLQVFGALYGLRGAALRQRAQAVLAAVGLTGRAGDRPATFSGGMKRRLHIACALMHDPDVLLLDEPTAGVDPQSRNAIFDTLLALRDAGKALVYTTHYMEEVERLADRIVVIDHGRVIAEGTLEALLRGLPSPQKLELTLDGMLDADALRALPGVRRVTASGDRWTVALDDLGRQAAPVLAWLATQPVALRHLASARASLEDVFLALTGRALRD